MLVAIASGYLIAMFAPLLARAFKSATGPMLAAVPGFLLAYFLQFVPEAAQGRPWRFAFPWGGPGGLEAVFWLDALALLFAVMITLLAAVALLATAGLTLSTQARGRLLLAMLSLMSSSLGFVLADTPVLVMGFAVLATLSVFLLMTARRGAAARVQRIPVLVALLASDLVLIAALGGVFIGSGAVGLADLTAHALPDTIVVRVAAVLLVMAGLTRLIILPVDLRAPRSSMTSEAPILLAQCGAYVPLVLYTVLRFAPTLQTAPDIRLVLGLAGAVFLVVGAVTGLRARRLRTLLTSLTPLFFSLAFIHLASFGTRAASTALLITFSHGLGIAVMLLASQFVSRGDHWVGLDTLKAATHKRPSVLGLFGGGILALVGLLPSVMTLTLSQSLESGLGSPPNPTEIGFAIAAHAIIIALLVMVARNLLKSSGLPALGERSAAPAQYLAAGLVLVLLVVSGWSPFILERLFVAAVVARSGAPIALDPFWPQGIAIAFAACAFALAGLLVWFDPQIKRALDWCALALPRRPMRLWSVLLTQTGTGARLVAQLIGRIGHRPLSTALAAIISIVFVWLAVEVFRGPMPPLAVNLLPLAALAASAALAALIATLQPNAERLTAVLSIASLLAALALLAERAADLAYLLILVLVLETAILLVLAPRLRDQAMRSARPRVKQSLRSGLALVCGVGASLTAVAVSQLSLDPMNWTRFDQVELWAAILAIVLVLGIIATGLNRQWTRQS